MPEIENLLNILHTLLGENGCAWDRAQTMLSMRASLLEEACETIDAIDSGDKVHIEEELGDLFFNAVFLCLLAEKEKCSTLQNIVGKLNEKLIYRHPHIFGDSDNENPATAEAVLEQWDILKAAEKGKDSRKSVLDGIPKALPALARAQKVFGRMKKQGVDPDLRDGSTPEMALGNSLLKLVVDAQAQGIEAEFALRNALDKAEAAFRAQETA